MIKHITLQNFKSIKRSSVSFPSIVAIVGENAAGKTNLIQSIKFLKSLVLNQSTAEAQNKISLVPNELFNFNEVNNEFSIDFTLETRNEVQYLLSIKLSLKNGTVKPPKLYIHHEKLTKINVEDRSSSEVIYHRDNYDFKQNDDKNIPLAIEPDQLALALYKNPDTDQVKSFFNDLLIPDLEHLNNLDSIGLGKVGRASNELPDILVSLRHNRPNDYNNFFKIIKKFMPYLASFIEIPAGNPNDESTKGQYLILLEENNLRETLSIQSASTGDIRTLYLIASALNMEDSSCLVIEEIENGIHPKRVIDLIAQLETIAHIKNMQLIFTTHSPVVINRLPASQVIFTEKKANNGTTFTLLENAKDVAKITELLRHGGKLSDYLDNLNS